MTNTGAIGRLMVRNTLKPSPSTLSFALDSTGCTSSRLHEHPATGLSNAHVPCLAIWSMLKRTSSVSHTSYARPCAYRPLIQIGEYSTSFVMVLRLTGNLGCWGELGTCIGVLNNPPRRVTVPTRTYGSPPRHVQNTKPRINGSYRPRVAALAAIVQ